MVNIVNEAALKGFRIVEHTYRLSRNGGGRVGYHCPDCGSFYAEGNFSIENKTHVLGSSERKSCCGKERPTPLLFETSEKVRDFVRKLQASGAWEKATLIAKLSLVTAHFDKKVFEELKRKTLH